MLSIETVPLPVRAALATAVALAAGRLGYELTESEAVVSLTIVLWALGGLAEVARAYVKRKFNDCESGDCE